MMAENESSYNTTPIMSFANAEIPMPRIVRFWILLIFEVPSTGCALFVLFYILTDHKLRSSVKNHALIILLLTGLGCQLIDIPSYLSFIIHSYVVNGTPFLCNTWWFADIGLYNGGAIIMAWLAFERHILVFHDRLLSTRSGRILIHYLPLSFLVVYICTFYIYAMYFFPCENTYDYTLPLCDGSPCYENDPIMGMWDLTINSAASSILEGFFSLTFLIRVIWRKHRARVPIQRRKQRKMTIQLMCLSTLNLTFNFPLTIIQIVHLCGVPSNVGLTASQYLFFFCYFVIFIIPFICLVSIGNVKKTFQEKIFRRRQQVRQFQVGVELTLFTVNTAPRKKTKRS